MRPTSDIEQKIKRMRGNQVFFASNFSEEGSPKTVRTVLQRMTLRGSITRLAPGIYCKPLVSKYGIVPPSAQQIAEAIAQRDHVQIMPTGATASNMLGLSTQVPLNAVYLTTGTGRTVTVGNLKIKFLKGAPRNFAYKTKLIGCLVQALKDIGKGNLTEQQESVIYNLLEKFENKVSLKSDVLFAPQWMQELLLPMINKQVENEVLAKSSN